MDFTKWKIRRSDSGSLLAQLISAIESAMETGELPAGTRLPSERDLATLLRLSRTTVTNAYRELESRGLLRGHVGRGTFVCASPEPGEAPFAWRGKVSATALRAVNPGLRNLMRDAGNPGLISFALGSPALDHFPAEEFQCLTRQVMKAEPYLVFGLGPTEGQYRLREAIASHTSTRPERILIVSGSQQGLDLLAKCLIDPGDVIIVDRPCYLGAIQTFRSAGAKLIGWDIRRCDLAELEDLILRHRPKMIFTNPTFQNPTGRTLSMAERRELLRLAARYRVPLVEDDAYRELYIDAPPPPALRQLDEYNVVIALNTFSKMLAPGLRLGWVTATEVIVDQLALLKQNTDMYTMCLTQLVVAEMLNSGRIEEHVDTLRREYRKRRDAMLAALKRTRADRYLSYSQPPGGAYVWCRLTRGLTTAQVLEQAKRNGVSFASGEVFYCDEGGTHELRLCFTGLPVEKIELGIGGLAKSLEACANSQPDRPYSIAVV